LNRGARCAGRTGDRREESRRVSGENGGKGSGIGVEWGGGVVENGWGEGG